MIRPYDSLLAKPCGPAGAVGGRAVRRTEPSGHNR